MTLQPQLVDTDSDSQPGHGHPPSRCAAEAETSDDGPVRPSQQETGRKSFADGLLASSIYREMAGQTHPPAVRSGVRTTLPAGAGHSIFSFPGVFDPASMPTWPIYPREAAARSPTTRGPGQRTPVAAASQAKRGWMRRAATCDGSFQSEACSPQSHSRRTPRAPAALPCPWQKQTRSTCMSICPEPDSASNQSKPAGRGACRARNSPARRRQAGRLAGWLAGLGTCDIRDIPPSARSLLFCVTALSVCQ